MAEPSVKQQIVDLLRDSTNVLVTVNTDPSVDELSAALGITLLINKMNKHATAVYSGKTPPAIEFLQPEKTFESTVDSLRDFIIALDKEKADHLRYKVEGDVVKIFITPYRTVINEKDLDFSQGDYNVDMVIAIGVKSEDDLDKALSAHGRILHDASVVSLSLEGDTKLGTLNWFDRRASSYSEMLETIADLAGSDKKLIDEQIATAFLTGIVAATERFSNNRTSSDVMTTAARLMDAGANQQLIATKLEEANEIPTKEPEDAKKENDDSGNLEEGKSEKIDRSEPAEPEAKEADDKNDDDSAGGLMISHEPQGDVDEVAAQVAEKRQKSAAEKAEEELAKQTQAVAEAKQTAAADEAENKLAEELASTAPILPAPVADLKSELEYEAAEPAQQIPAPAPEVSVPEMAEPSLGGTLNATTEQAAADKLRELADDRNKTILSHDGDSYVSEQPMFQAPLNATNQMMKDEPVVRDVLSEAPTTHANFIQPPSPVQAPTQTLADIDEQNRAAHDSAVNDIQQAFESAPTELPAPVAPVSQPVPQDLSTIAPTPALPPLPPMPDFTQLPELPPELQQAMPQQATTPSLVQDNPLGEAFPPAQPAPVPAPQSNDPSQFRIPGQ